MSPTIFLIFLHIFAILWGIHSGAARTSSQLDILYPITAGFIAVLACTADARKRQTPIVSMVQLIMLVFWPIATPVYVMWSRSWVGILWALLWTVTFSMSYFLPAVLVFMYRS